MLTLKFWKVMDGNRLETLAVEFTAVRQQGNMLYATHPERGEAAVAEAAKGLEPFKVTWLPMAPHFTSDKMLYYHGFEIKNIEEPAKVATAVKATESEKLTFADLKRGDKFICFPVDGDNSGHGGYLGESILFVVTQEARFQRGGGDPIGLSVNIGRGVESNCPGEMPVIKVV